MTRGRRDPSLDIARGIAIVMVVLGHVLGGLLDAGIGQPPPGTDRFVVALYVTHLPVFAFVTGLLMPAAVERAGRAAYLSRRLTLILYLYLLWTLIQGSIEVLTSGVRNHPTSWVDVLSVWAPLAHLWFLPTLAVATVLVVAVRPWRRGWHAVAGLLVAGGSLAAWGWSFPVAGAHGLALLLWFMAGAAITGDRFAALAARVPPAALAALAVVAVGVLVALTSTGLTAPTLYDASRTVGSVGRGLAATLCGLIVTLALALARLPRGGAGLAFLGQQSLPIYLAHIVFAAGTRVLLQRLGVDHFVLVAALATLVGVAGPIVLVRLPTATSWLFAPPWMVPRRAL